MLRSECQSHRQVSHEGKIAAKTKGQRRGREAAHLVLKQLSREF